MTANAADAFLHESVINIEGARDHILHCLSQLNDEQAWWRPFEEANSIANILLHLCGNMTQWIIAPLTGRPDLRRREEEFARRDATSIAELRDRFVAVAGEAVAILKTFDSERLLDALRVQGYEVSVMGALYNSISHLRGHEQEIVYITRLQLQGAYRYWMDPQRLNNPERPT